MKSTQTKFEKVKLAELKKVLPEIELKGRSNRETDLPKKPAKATPKG